MKRRIVLFLCLIASSPALAQQRSHVHAGKEVGNGGNGTRSTPEEVNQVIDRELSFEVGYALAEAKSALDPESNFPIRDPKARELFGKILALPQLSTDPKHEFAYNGHSSVPFVKNEEGACRDSGEARDASVKLVPNPKYPDVFPDARICLSIPRLTRFPKESLKREIGALVLHELAHAAGYGEEDAVYLQKYALGKLGTTCRIEMGLKTEQTGGLQGRIFYVDLGESEEQAKLGLYYQPQSAGTPGNNGMEIDTWQAPGDLSLRWDMEKGGELRFLAMNSDGTYSKESIQFGEVKKTNYPDPYYSDQVLASSMTFDGRPLTPVGISFSEECLR